MHFKREHHTLFRMSNPEFLLTKVDKESGFEIVKRPVLEFQSESIETLSSTSQSTKDSNQEKEENQQIGRVTVHKQDDSASSTTPSSEEKVEDEEEDGFKTPTSLDHKILVPSQCPPAPRKIKSSLKRKASCYNHCNCRHPLDLSKEVFELLFPTQHISPLSGSQQSTKRVRRQDHN
ncbi:unnamed protein product [Sphenostylis stenocarpa]|uniref:Uncharacterized protein n=1 Tax=Sphenostylis stenocarpa TaxID=92480 RepID=A0AA86RLR0_9FABA|nr:unnamed protein product [Sphenostylis stenocarpa]